MSQLQASRPLLCRLTFHRVDAWSMRSDGHPCEQVRRCKRCELEMQAEAFHDWGAPRRSAGNSCTAVFTCAECGEQKTDVAHVYQEQTGDDCLKIVACTVCRAQQSRSYVHDYRGTNPECQRCGFDGSIDEA
ncbi:hypothetical protein ACFVWG_05380 [Kribbella sp. NPDC058245]|uniref:hypothetical protein n=1 Tax=Kribbella sp. NPDC058245 TaxID=3346399 RepID=UPI0036EA4C44